MTLKMSAVMFAIGSSIGTGACSDVHSLTATAGAAADGSANSQANPSSPEPSPSPSPSADQASSPQAVSGAYLTDCGPDGSNQYGCVVANRGSQGKTNATISNPTVIVTLNDGTSLAPVATLTSADSPWSLQFPVPVSDTTKITGIVVSANIGGAQVTSAASSTDFTPEGSNSSGSALAISASVSASSTATTTAGGTETVTTVSTGTTTNILTAESFSAADAIVFVTRATFIPGSSFHGASAADSACAAAAATTPGSIMPATRTWVAVISALGRSMFSNVPSTSTTVVDSTNQVVANTSSELTGSTLLHAVSTDETGAPVGSTLVWTGANTDGSNNLLRDCNNWSGGLNSTGNVGEIVTASPGWFSSEAVACSTAGHLYCLGK